MSRQASSGFPTPSRKSLGMAPKWRRKTHPGLDVISENTNRFARQSNVLVTAREIRPSAHAVFAAVRTRIAVSGPYFVIVCLVGVTVDVGAAFEMAKVNQTFQPSGRFSAANSL
jgi:hypothetical protein